MIQLWIVLFTGKPFKNIMSCKVNVSCFVSIGLYGLFFFDWSNESHHATHISPILPSSPTPLSTPYYSSCHSPLHSSSSYSLSYSSSPFPLPFSPSYSLSSYIPPPPFPSPSLPLLPLLLTVTCAVPNICNMNPPSDSWSAGTVEPRRISLDNSIHFTCQPGYFRTGPHEATCTINGTWTTLSTSLILTPCVRSGEKRTLEVHSS